MAKKTNTPAAQQIQGTRVVIPKTAYQGLPAVRFPSDGGHVTVVGVGKTGEYCSWKKARDATKHRSGFTVIGNALIVGNYEASGQSIAKFLASHGLTAKADAGSLSGLPIPASGNTRRWATQAETDAYVKAECEMRRKMLGKAVAYANAQRRKAEKMLVEAQRTLDAWSNLDC